MQHKTAWALETGIIRDNYMTCVFILISAKSRIGTKAFLTVGYEKWQSTYLYLQDTAVILRNRY